MQKIIFLIFFVLSVAACVKDPYLKSDPFSTGESTNAYFNYVDSGILPGTAFWTNYVNATQKLDLDNDGIADFFLSLYQSTSPGRSIVKRELRSRSGCSFSLRERLFYKHFKDDTVLYNQNDTLLVYRTIWDQNNKDSLGTKLYLDMPVLQKNVSIDALGNWTNNTNNSFLMYNYYHTASSGLIPVRQHVYYTTSLSEPPLMDWNGNLYSYLAVRKKAQNIYKYGWILIDKDYKVIATAMQK